MASAAHQAGSALGCARGSGRPAWRRGEERMSDSIRTGNGSIVMASGAGRHAGRGQVEPETNAEVDLASAGSLEGEIRLVRASAERRDGSRRLCLSKAIGELSRWNAAIGSWIPAGRALESEACLIPCCRRQPVPIAADSGSPTPRHSVDRAQGIQKSIDLLEGVVVDQSDAQPAAAFLHAQPQ